MSGGSRLIRWLSRYTLRKIAEPEHGTIHVKLSPELAQGQYMPSRTTHQFVIFALAAALFLLACNAVQGAAGPSFSTPNATSPPPPSPTETSPAQAPTTKPPQDTPPEENLVSAAGVLAACEVGNQAHAMRPDDIPDWRAISLGACYDLTLELNPDESTYRGTALVTLANQTGGPLADLVFRTYPNSDEIYGGALKIEGAAVNGNAVDGEVFQADETAYRLPLEEPLQPGETVQVEMAFSGRIPEDFDGLPTVYGVFNHNTSEQFISMANWYPVLAQNKAGQWITQEVVGNGDAVVSEAALYQVSIAAPEDWALITTGSELNRTGRFVSGPVRDFIVLASPNLTEITAEVDGTTVRHWGLPGGEGRWEQALDASANSMEVFNERFGAYPYAELDVLAAPLRNALGVEYPGVFLIGDRLYSDDPENDFWLSLVVAHEAAHQWWYGVVGSDVLVNPWQDEGLTTFSSSLYQEIYQPRYYEGTLNSYQETVSRVEQLYSDEELAIAQPLDSFQERGELYSPVVYQKGALFFQALREILGDRTFFDALQSYYLENHYGLVEPEALLEAFEEACECSLDDIYREWGAINK